MSRFAPPRRWACAWLGCAAMTACRGALPEPAIAARPPAPPPIAAPSIAVAPPQWATEDTLPIDLDAAVRRGFEGARIRVVDAKAAIDRRGESCAADEACVQEAARDAGAEKLVRTKLATLGGTVLVRVGVVDVSSGTRDEERQEVVNAATPDRIQVAIASLAKQIAKPYVPPPPLPPPLPEKPRWYGQWWVWTIIGAAVVGTGVAVGVAASMQGQGPDVVVTPP